jgi:hypoxanthine phosphoribosyltransferase
MSQKPYNYQDRKNIHPVSWNDFHGLCKGLAEAVSPYRPELILAVGRGGFYPGTLIAHLLQAEVYPIRLSRRVNDIVQYQTPQWMVEPPAIVKGHRILVVDEICDSGATLSISKEKVEVMGAASVRSAVLYAHTWGAATPDYIGLITDTLLLNPWDREIYKDGKFQFHPEYVQALAQQGIEAELSLLIAAPISKIAKDRPSS